MGVAVSVELGPGSEILGAGIALTGVGATTVDAAQAAAELLGAPLSAASVERAANLAAQAATPRSDHRGSAEYKRHIVHTFVTRILHRVSVETERAA